MSDTEPPFDPQGLLASSTSAAATATYSSNADQEDMLSDAAVTCFAITNCFLAGATSFLGHHYLASHRRASLHAFARGVFLDAKVGASLLVCLRKGNCKRPLCSIVYSMGVIFLVFFWSFSFVTSNWGFLDGGISMVCLFRRIPPEKFSAMVGGTRRATRCFGTTV